MRSKGSSTAAARWPRCGTACLAVVCALLATACTGHKTSGPVLFNGTFHGNEAESKMPPGMHVPTDYVGVMKDDGVRFHSVQTYTTPSGQPVRHVWDGVCDGQLTPVQGASGGARLGCVRTPQGEMINTVTDDNGYRQVETCRMSRQGTRETCVGTMTLPAGSTQDFVYVFDQ
jgi:hypothetical protein